MDLTSLTDEKLQALIDDAQAEQRARQEKRTADLLEYFRVEALKLGLAPAKLAAALTKRAPARASATTAKDGRSDVKPKYRNPKNPSETWAGRGAKPKWYEAHLAAGGKADDLLIPNRDAA